MSKITVNTDPSRGDVAFVSDNLRKADFEEFVMATGRHPLGLLANRALACGAHVAEMDGIPVAVFGCVPQGSTGAPWMLGTDRIAGFEAARALLEIGRDCFNKWAAEYPEGLRHRAYASNALHLRYIRALGAELDEPQPFGPSGALFREFTYVLHSGRD